MGRHAQRPPWLDWLLGIVLLAGLSWLVQWRIGWTHLLSSWGQLTFSQMIVPLIFASVSYLARGWRLQVFFYPTQRGYIPPLMRISFLHNLANNLLPMRLGEVVLPVLMKAYLQRDLKSGFSGLIWLRLMDLHLVAGAAIVVSALVLSWQITMAMFTLWLIGLGLLIHPRLPTWTAALPLSDKLKPFSTALAEARPQGRSLMEIYALTFVVWSFKLMGFGLLLSALSDLLPWQSLLGALGGELTSILPIHGVAGAGSYEGGMIALLMPFGFDLDSALAAAVHLHLFLLGLSLIFGLIALTLPKTVSPRSL
jgi:glycosyltransferase 2 family protein